MNIKNERGIALSLTLFVMLFLLTISAIFVLKAVADRRFVIREVNQTKAQYIAEAGTYIALDSLQNLVNNYILNTMSLTNPSVVVSVCDTYYGTNDGLGFLVLAVNNSGSPTPLVANAGNTQATYTVGSTSYNGGTYNYQIAIQEKANPTKPSTDNWDFSYTYQVTATGSLSGTSKNIKLSGDFTVQVQRDNFAKYALFTNNQALPDGTSVWFTGNTAFSGPIHTNDRFNIAKNPSGVFDGLATQVQATARFYNNGSPLLINGSNNGTIDVPTFNAGFNRSVSSIALSSPIDQTTIINEASGNQTFATNGIYLPNSGGNLVGGIYVRGDASVAMSVNGSNNAVYTISQGATTKTITVNTATNQTTVTSGSTTTTYNGIPDGVDHLGTIVYVTGQISSLSGTVQQDTQATVSAANDINITNNVTYQSYSPAVGTPGTVGYVPPSATGYNNLLGIVTWNGNVNIATSAPNNINIHGTILAKNGMFQVTNYNSGSPRGTATLLGGIIQNNYGAFGTFNGSTGAMASGYGRNFVYDERMQVGTAPPYYPSLNTFIAFTNDISDKVVFQEY